METVVQKRDNEDMSQDSCCRGGKVVKSIDEMLWYENL